MTKRQNRPWYLYALAVVVIVLAVLGVTEIGPPTSSARTSTQIVTAENGVIQSMVTGTGNVAAGQDLDVNFQTSGTLSKVYVTAGQHVTKGQLLATLDPTAAQLSLKQAEQNLTAAEDQLSTAESGSTSATSPTAATATTLDTTSSQATTEFVSDTKTVPTTTTKTTTTKTTTPKTTPTKTTHSQTTSTKTTPAPTTTRPTATTTPSSPATAPSAAGGSSGSNTGSSTTTTPSPATIASAQAAVYSAQANVNTAKAALADTTLSAPISGTIVSLSGLSPGDTVSAGSTSSSSGSSTSSSGSSSTSSTGTTSGTTAGSLGGSSSSSSSSSASATPFAEIVNTGSMTMTVALSESDISKVKVGQTATVTLDALTGVELAAHVTTISTVGTTSSGVVSYDATLTLDQKNSQVKPGMSASASIIVAQAHGVNVPNSAVTGTGSVATVMLVSNGNKTQRQVAIGLRGTSRTQIVSGLSAGQQLAVTTILPPLTSGTTTSSTGSGTLGGTAVRPGFGGGGFPGGGGGFGGVRPGGGTAAPGSGAAGAGAGG